MFRRKEESATDFSPTTATAATSAPASSTGAHTSETSSASSAAPAAAAIPPAAASSYSAPAHSSYAPSVISPRTPSEPARPVASAASGTYRPSPVAEFNRAVARPAASAEPARASASAQQTGASSFSSLTSSHEKNTVGKPNRRVLTVGNDILLKGEIATCDRLVIEGRVEAKLSEVHTVEIAECGSFKGTAEVEDAEISGIFEGDLVVRNRLVIYATGEVRGNIGYGEIEIERGGKLTGEIKTVSGNAGVQARMKSLDVTDAKAKSKESVAA